MVGIEPGMTGRGKVKRHAVIQPAFSIGDMVQVIAKGHCLHRQLVTVIGTNMRFQLGDGPNRTTLGPFVSVEMLGGDLHGERFGLPLAWIQKINSSPADIALYRRRVARMMEDKGLTAEGMRAARALAHQKAVQALLAPGSLALDVL